MEVENVTEKKQHFFQAVKCPCCNAEIVFEWEAVGSVTAQKEQ
jgi:ribosomal protein S27E